MMREITPSETLRLLGEGKIVLVDLRAPADFARDHPKGAISIPFSEKGLEKRLAVVLPAGTQVILLAEGQEQAEAALGQLQGGQFPVLGTVEGGTTAWQKAALPVDSLAEMTVQELASSTSSQEMVVLDVREPMEWEMGHVPGAILISLGSLREQLHAIPREGQVAVICEAGVRSSTAASILQAEGFLDVANVPEGTGGYRQGGYPLQFYDP